MFEVKTNSRFKKQYYPTIGVGIGTCIFFIVFGIGLGIDFFVTGEKLGASVCLFLGVVGLLIFASMVNKELHKGLDKYYFNGNQFSVKKYNGKVKQYSVDEISMCQFFPQCMVYKRVYADAIYFIMNNRIDKPIAIYKGYHENFNEVRQWIFDNNIEVTVHANEMGEKNLRYVQFMDRGREFK